MSALSLVAVSASSLLVGTSMAANKYFVTDLANDATVELKLYNMGTSSMADHYDYSNAMYNAVYPPAVSDTAMMYLSTNDAGDVFFTNVLDSNDGTGGMYRPSVTGLPSGATVEVLDDPSESVSLNGNYFSGDFGWLTTKTDGFSLRLGDTSTLFSFDMQSLPVVGGNMVSNKVMTFNTSSSSVDTPVSNILRFFSVDESDLPDDGDLFDGWRCIDATTGERNAYGQLYTQQAPPGTTCMCPTDSWTSVSPFGTVSSPPNCPGVDGFRCVDDNSFERRVNGTIYSFDVPPGTVCQCPTTSWVKTTPYGTESSQQSCVTSDMNVETCYELNTCAALNATQCAEKLPISHAFLTLDQCTELQGESPLMPACEYFVCQNNDDFSLVCSESLVTPSNNEIAYCPSGYSTMSECPNESDMLCATDGGSSTTLTCTATCSSLGSSSSFVGDATSLSMIENQQEVESNEPEDSSAFAAFLGVSSVMATIFALVF